MKKRSVVFALAALMIVACEESPTEPESTLSFQTVVSASHSGIVEQRGEVITSQERWAQVWSEIQAGVGPEEPARPQIDFARRSVIMAAMGEQQNGCYAIEVERVRESGGSVQVTARRSRADAACACLAFIARPVHVVTIDTPRAHGVVAFTKLATRPCS